jgi:hypothetical protein
MEGRGISGCGVHSCSLAPPLLHPRRAWRDGQHAFRGHGMLCSPRYWWLSLQPGGSWAEDLHEVRSSVCSVPRVFCPPPVERFPSQSWVAGYLEPGLQSGPGKPEWKLGTSQDPTSLPPASNQLSPSFGTLCGSSGNGAWRLHSDASYLGPSGTQIPCAESFCRGAFFPSPALGATMVRGVLSVLSLLPRYCFRFPEVRYVFVKPVTLL